jgi:sortase A
VNAVRTVVGGVGEMLVTAGALVLLFLAWQLWWTDVVADRAQDRTTEALLEQWDAAGGSDLPGQDGDPAPVQPGGSSLAPEPVAPGPSTQEQVEQAAALAELPARAVALLRVPAFGDGWVRPVLEGTGTAVLQQGVGHYSGAALPGEVGNFAVAGHRTTYGAPFGPIADLVTGDPVVVETASEFHVYRVTDSQVVLPGDVEVIAPVPDRPGDEPTQAFLTMTSCHPMFSARERYVVHALLESSTPRTDGPPAVLAAGAGVG